MRDTYAISDVIIHAALPADRFAGLLCYASLHIGAFRIDGLQVRRRRDGRHYVRWPARKDAAGYEHSYLQVADPMVRPVVKAAVERAVFSTARSEGWLP